MSIPVLRRHRISARFAETAIVAVILSTALYLTVMRLDHRRFPSGDEGSWMSVAAQLTRGEGFTTRWYEHPFLKHPMLPRPDDFRYPGLTLILAATFAVFGISYPAALGAIGGLFLAFLMFFYLIIRKIYGVRVGVIALSVTAFSLAQLEWNSAVYCEGLFGIGLSALIAANLFQDLSRFRSWALVGLACGILYYVRPNGVLFLAGFLVYAFLHRSEGRKAFMQMAIGLAVFFICVFPWMLRNWALFDNPLHITGGAGVLRAAPNDPYTWSCIDFISHYGPVILLKMLSSGAIHFFQALHFFEKNLFVLPLIGAGIGLFHRRPFGNSFIATGFILSFLACFYVSYSHSWAGVRYATPFMPFMYAYGIAELIRVCKIISQRMPPRIRAAPMVVCAALLLAPVYYPHRHYHRVYAHTERCDRSFVNHRKLIDSLVPPNGYYLADSYGQLAFLSTRNCAGIQMMVDSSYIKEYLARYKPALLVLGNDESALPRMRGIMREMNRMGVLPDSASRIDGGNYYVLQYKMRSSGYVP
jgi:hypothetical protein